VHDRIVVETADRSARRPWTFPIRTGFEPAPLRPVAQIDRVPRGGVKTSDAAFNMCRNAPG